MRVLPFWILFRLKWRSASDWAYIQFDSAQVKVWRLNRALERQPLVAASGHITNLREKPLTKQKQK